MSYQRVTQESEYGCFVATVACLLGSTYQEAFKLIHPGTFMTPYNGGVPIEDAPKLLKKLGWKLRKTTIKHISSIKKDALILITWRDQPDLSHAVIYDAKEKKVIDPINLPPFKNRTYERHLNSIYYIEDSPKGIKS